MLADILTKPVAATMFKNIKGIMGVQTFEECLGRLRDDASRIRGAVVSEFSTASVDQENEAP